MMCVYDLNSCLDVSQPQLPELETEDKNSFSSSFYRVCDAADLCTPLFTLLRIVTEIRGLFFSVQVILWFLGLPRGLVVRNPPAKQEAWV